MLGLEVGGGRLARDARELADGAARQLDAADVARALLHRNNVVGGQVDVAGRARVVVDHDRNGRGLGDVDKEADERGFVKRARVVAAADDDGDVGAVGGGLLRHLDGRARRAEAGAGDDGDIGQAGRVESLAGRRDQRRPLGQRQVVRLAHGSEEARGVLRVSTSARSRASTGRHAPCDDREHADLGERDDVLGERFDVCETGGSQLSSVSVVDAAAGSNAACSPRSSFASKKVGIGA